MDMISGDEAREISRRNLSSKDRPDVSRFIDDIDACIRIVANRGKSQLFWDGARSFPVSPTQDRWPAIIAEVREKGYLVSEEGNGILIEW